MISILSPRIESIIKRFQDFGVVRATSLAVNRVLWPALQISMLYRIGHLKIDTILNKMKDDPFKLSSHNLICRHLDVLEIDTRKHYFSEKKMSEFHRRQAIGVNSLFLLTRDEKEILGFIQWTSNPVYFDNTFCLTIKNSPGSIYIPEISINKAYRQLNYGHYLGMCVYQYLVDQGYNRATALTRFENIPSIKVQQELGGIIEKKYFFLFIGSSGWVFPLIPSEKHLPDIPAIYSGDKTTAHTPE